MSDKLQDKADTALSLAHFAASPSAVLVAALHRGKPITDSDVQHLLKTLATASATAPEAASGLFQQLAETVAGKHYEAG